MGRAPLLLGQGATVGLWLPAGTAGPALPLPLHGLRPCPSAGTASTEQPLGHLARQGALTAVTLSSPACVLCDQVEEDLSFLGNKEKNCGFYYHPFCALFANGLCEFVEGNSEARFCTEDLIRTVRQAEQKLCFVCGNSGATITCAETGCDRSFHFPCTSKGDCINQYFVEFRSFCWEHRPQQAVEAAPTQDTTCIICMEPVGDSRSYCIMVCRACQQAWFHQACIQEQAMHAGIYCFQCPVCRDWTRFIPDMLILGIRIPFRPIRDDSNAYAALPEKERSCDTIDCPYPRGREQAEREGRPTWEDSSAYAALLERHRSWKAIDCPYPRGREQAEREGFGQRPTQEDRHGYAALPERHRSCDAIECLHPRGREQAEREGPWELLLCCSCAAQSTHRRCSYVSQSRKTWDCNACAGEGTASSTLSYLASLSTISQQGPGPSQCSATPESSSSNTFSQAPSGPANCSSVPESSIPSSQSRTGRRRSSPRLQRDKKSFKEPRGHRGGSRNAAPSAESSTLNSARQGTSRTPRHSPAAGSSRGRRQGRRAQTRSNSPLQRRATGSPRRCQRRRGTSRNAAPTAESSTPNSASQGTSRSLRHSPAAGSSRGRRQGRRAQTRSNSPLQRRATGSPRRRQRRRGTSRNAAPTAKSSTPNSARQGTSRSPRRSPAAGSSRRRRQGQRAQTRSRSPLQRRATGSPRRCQRRHGSRQAPARSAERRTNRRRQRRAPRSSRVSAAADGSRSRQPGRARTRSRSPLQRRAAETHSQPQRRRRSRSRRRRPAQRRRYTRAPRWQQIIDSWFQ
ncbi:serine/arginine repetitive matrix protein 2-like isoform X2 [Gallus gallus]|uniref:serine/arginine repetitive matrix protein 2-like isoform X2 n=1 Tax=Gallus gallus TaxID=9031 RepID=UPI001AE39E3C|nr:serine/arginine repetitive matrix protein 2-like isoform X2 [Gallus gallus]